MSDGLNQWFKSEILVHEDVLMRFLARHWPNRNELVDLRQEAYVRVYEAARGNRPQAPKAFLFSIARHIMADRRRPKRAGTRPAFNPLIFQVGVGRSRGGKSGNWTLSVRDIAH
jgi:DNA-directed RNA polymerase specialized sigma24 family protein